MCLGLQIRRKNIWLEFFDFLFLVYHHYLIPLFKPSYYALLQFSIFIIFNITTFKIIFFQKLFKHFSIPFFFSLSFLFLFLLFFSFSPFARLPSLKRREESGNEEMFVFVKATEFLDVGVDSCWIMLLQDLDLRESIMDSIFLRRFCWTGLLCKSGDEFGRILRGGYGFSYQIFEVGMLDDHCWT